MEKTVGVFIETVGSLFDFNLKDPDKKKGGGEDNIDYSQITILNKKNKLPHPHPCSFTLYSCSRPPSQNVEERID